MSELAFEDRVASRLVSKLISKTATNISGCVGGTEKRLELRGVMFECDNVLQRLWDHMWDHEIASSIINILYSLSGPMSLLFTAIEAINIILEQDSDLVQNGRRWHFSPDIVDCFIQFIREQTYLLELASNPDPSLFCDTFRWTENGSNQNLETLFAMIHSSFPSLQLSTLAGKVRFDKAHHSAQLSFYNMNEDGKDGDHYEPGAIEETGSEPLYRPVSQPEICDPTPFYSIINRWKGVTRQDERNTPRQALLGFFAPDDLDREKCVMIGLCRDMVEWVVEETLGGSDNPEETKCRQGQHSCWSIVNELKQFNPKAAQTLLRLWLDCENGLSNEGRFMKQLDSLDLTFRRDGDISRPEMEGQGLPTDVAQTEHQSIANIIMSPIIQEGKNQDKMKQLCYPTVFIIGDAVVDWRPYTVNWSALARFQVEAGDQLCHNPAPGSLLQQRGLLQDSTSRGIPLPPWLAVDALWSTLEGRKNDVGVWTLVHGFPKSMAHVKYYEDKVQPMHFSIIIHQPPTQGGNQSVPETPYADVISHLRSNGRCCKEVEFGPNFEQQMKQALVEILISRG